MFFTNKKSKKEQGLIDLMVLQRAEIQKRLEEVSELNTQLAAVVQETHSISAAVMDKLKKELKIAKKSLTSICRRLKEGVLLVNNTGQVVEVNTAGQKMLGVTSTDLIGRQLTEMVSWVKGENQTTPIVLSVDFFENLSTNLLERAITDHTVDKDRIDDLLPEFLNFEHEITLDVHLAKIGQPFKFFMTFSILDNDPENLNDVTYIFLFRPINTRADDLNELVNDEMKILEHV
jgi:PAS domain-containing protein